MKKVLPYLVIILVTALIFFKSITQGLYPVPGDLLVSFYFPFYSGGWDGYDSFTTRKALNNADSIRQIYPWKELSMNMLKAGEFPLWNPYSFSGQPLMANFQTGAFYPLNAFYLILNSKMAWIALVMLQPILIGSFMYLALKSFRFSTLSTIFGSIAMIFSSYAITWMENVNVGHSFAWIPLALYAINNYFSNSKQRYLVVIIFALTMSILAGHPQTAIYAFIITILFFTFKAINHRKLDNLKYLLPLLVFPLIISSIQVIPTLDFYLQSPTALPSSKEIFGKMIMPPQGLLTFFASDFYGNPSTNNLWSKSYEDFTPHIGIIPFALFLIGSVLVFKEKITRFWILIAFTFVLASTVSPLTYLIQKSGIPIIDSTTPARFISISIIAMIIISTHMFDKVLKNINDKKYLSKLVKASLIIGFIYLALWIFTIFGHEILNPIYTWSKRLSVSKRNLVLPTVTIVLFISSLLLSLWTRFPLKIKQFALAIVFISAILVNGLYYTNKYLPFAPTNFIFPPHPVFTWLKENGGLNRFHGFGTATVDQNMSVHYEVFGAEGYDTIRLKRYAELMASAQAGYVPEKYLRSDATFPQEENGYRKRLYDLLGVKYLLNKEDNPKSNADWQESKFPQDNVKGIWQYERFQIYERVSAIPRVFLSSKYTVLKNDEEIISKIYDNNHSLTTIIIEKNPTLTMGSNEEIVTPEIVSYNPNEAVFKTNINSNTLLFISDAYAKGWKAYLDGSLVNIHRANYAFRAVEVPKGTHDIRFSYEPASFKLGVILSMLSILSLTLFTYYSVKQKSF